MRRLRPAVRFLLPALAEVICLLLAWQAAAAVADLYPAAVSLRYRAPLTAAELAQAEQPEETEEGAQLRLAAAWYEEEGEAFFTSQIKESSGVSRAERKRAPLPSPRARHRCWSTSRLFSAWSAATRSLAWAASWSKMVMSPPPREDCLRR